MLETVVQQMQLRLELLLGGSASLVTIFADDHRHGELPRDQQRLVAELGGASLGINHQHTASHPAITSREDVEINLAFLQQHTERNHKWRLACSARRQVADADDRLLQLHRGEKAAVKQLIPQSDARAVESGQRIHAVLFSINCTSASTVLAVAPR